ncbi:MAG: hypothetical protein K2Q20_00810 [Phycisphaerales bacterium]|nr:hypothetical protein [Phycisphaerales bacterium]
MPIAARRSRGIDFSVLFLSAALGLSVLAMLGLHVSISPDPFVIAFELIVLLCAAFAFLLGLGRFRDGPALTLVCSAGIVGVASLLAFVASNQMLGGRSLVPYLGIRFGLAGALALIGAWTILRRRPREAMSSLAKGVGAGVLLVVGLAAGVKWGGAFASLSPVVVVLVGLIGATVGLGLLAASVHCIIRAFEFGHAAVVTDGPERVGG